MCYPKKKKEDSFAKGDSSEVVLWPMFKTILTFRSEHLMLTKLKTCGL
jgi:hypothetical protein